MMIQVAMEATMTSDGGDNNGKHAGIARDGAGRDDLSRNQFVYLAI